MSEATIKQLESHFKSLVEKYRCSRLQRDRIRLVAEYEGAMEVLKITNSSDFEQLNMMASWLIDAKDEWTKDGCNPKTANPKPS